MKIKWPIKILLFVALALAYMKTGEAMVQFAPRSFLGWTDPMLPILWAYVSALLVEGVALLAVDNLIHFTKDTPTRTTSAFVVVVSVAFSIAMNIIDQKITDHTFAGGIETPVGGFLYGLLGLIPIIAACMFGVMLIVDAYFPDKQGQSQGKQNSQQFQPNFQRQNQPSQHMSQQRQPERVPMQGPGNGNGRIYGNEQEMQAKLTDPRNPTPPA